MPHPAVTQVFVVILFFSSTQVITCMSLISNKNVALIQQVCQKTHDYGVCVSSLKSDPRSLNADLKDLVVIMMDVIIVKATKITELVDKLNKTSSDPAMKACFGLCSLAYGVSVGYLQKAIRDFKLASYRESYEHLTVPHKTPGECEDIFSELPLVRKSPLTATNAYFSSMVTVAQDILSNFINSP